MRNVIVNLSDIKIVALKSYQNILYILDTIVCEVPNGFHKLYNIILTLIK